MIVRLILAGATAALSTAGGAFATTYSYTTIDAPDTTFTEAYGINDSGAVTGADSGPPGSGELGYVYSGGTYTTLQFPGSSDASDTVGLQINDAGEVVGNFNTEAFFYSGGTGGTYTAIDYPKSITTVATGIDASGAVAGWYTVGRKALASGYVYSGGAYTRIKYPKSKDTYVEGIDTSGAVAGYYIKGSHEFGFVESGGAYTEIKFPKSSETQVAAISPSGALAGDYLLDDKEYGFMYLGGTYTRLRVPGSIETNATAINASGVVAGDYESAKEKDLGFVYSDGVYSTINIPGSTAIYVDGINASGEVTGRYFDSSADTYYGFIATPQAAAVMLTPSAAAAAPESSTWALMLTGFVGLGLIGYRKAASGRAALSAASLPTGGLRT
jgi:hypothetical protein